MFNTRRDLLDIWPDLVHHAALNLGSEDVLGFLGRKLHPSLAAEVVTDTQAPSPGVAGPASHGPQLGEDVRQGVGPQSRDGHQQSA